MVASIMFSVGEPSGDLHAAHLLNLLSHWDQPPHCFGMGGERMCRHSFEAVVRSEEMAVMGLMEVIREYPRLRRVFRQMVVLLQQRRPDLLILVDYPGFNLRLARVAHRMGVKVLYYISPKVWAWGAGRVRRMVRDIDHIALIFPFEQEIYRQAGLPATYVGHPLVGEVSCDREVADLRQQWGIPIDRPVVGLLPGSRPAEVRTLLPALLRLAESLGGESPEIIFLLSRAEGVAPALYQAVATAAVEIIEVSGDTHCLIRSCDAVVTASGTVTLEIALLDRPMVVVYRMAALSYAILSRLLRSRWISLVNIIADREVVPELLQQAVEPEQLSQQLRPLLQPHSEVRIRQLQGLAEVRQRLGEGRAAERLATLVAEMVR